MSGRKRSENFRFFQVMRNMPKLESANLCSLHTHAIHTFENFCPHAPAPGTIGNIRLYGNTKHCFVDSLPYALHRFHVKGVGEGPPCPCWRPGAVQRQFTHRGNFESGRAITITLYNACRCQFFAHSSKTLCNAL